MIRAAIVGCNGYTGGELMRVLTGHPDVDVTVATSRSQAGKPLAEVFPFLCGISDLSISSFDAEVISADADIAFTALPHGSSMETVNSLIEKGLKVIDLSADFRFNDASLYGVWYGEHRFSHLLKKSVYGLPEINRERIRDSMLVGNPGCYPTSAILPLVPLVKEGVVDLETIVINSVSGASGAGRTPAEGSLYCEVNEDFKAYKVAEHRHTPEIEAALNIFSASDIKVSFIPHLAPMNRGILTTITAKLKKDFSTEKITELLKRSYNDEKFVRVCGKGSLPSVSNVRGSNFCDIGVKVDGRTGTVVLISAIDNLVKGAAGQAVQNMNIMFGLNEAAGLGHIPLFL